MRIGSLDVSEASSVASMEQHAVAGRLEASLLSPAEALRDLPAAVVDEDAARAVGHGTVFRSDALGAAGSGDGPLRVLDRNGDLLAVYRIAGITAKPEVVIS